MLQLIHVLQWMFLATFANFMSSLVLQGSLMCKECPLGLSAFLSTRSPKDLKNIRYFCSIFVQKWPHQGNDHPVLLNKSDDAWNHVQIEQTLCAQGPWYRANTRGFLHAPGSYYCLFKHILRMTQTAYTTVHR